jgi:ABC-type siderophore export system fused ATPase/permease subunit
MKYAIALVIGGAALFTAARVWMLDGMMFAAAIVSIAFGITWAFLLAAKRQAEREAAAADSGEHPDRRAA